MTTYTATSALRNIEKAEKELPSIDIDTNGITYISAQLIRAARQSQDVEDIQSYIERAISMTGYKGAVQTAGELLRFEHLLIAVYRDRLLVEVELNQTLFNQARPDTDADFWEAHLGYSPSYNEITTRAY